MSASIRAQPMQAFWLALVVEIVLLCVATVVLARATQAKPTISEAVTISLLNEEAPPPPPLVKPPPAPPKARPQTQPTLPPPPLATPFIPPPVVETPSAFTEPVKPAPPPPPAPAAPSGKVDPNLEYAAKVRAAVQAAVYYPPAAAALRFSGRVRLEFTLKDAAASGARVLIASGIGLIDRAALQAVQAAAYPPPPPSMQGREESYQVWVEFNR